MLTEPALTNNHGLILPDEGFHDALRRITRATGTLLALDETHTQVVGAGGLTAAWALEPDLVTIGKSIAGGVPFGAWGMTDAIAEILVQCKGPDGELLTRLIRIWLANRGVWVAIVGAGPVCPVPATDEDVDAYLGAWDSLLEALTA